MDRFIELIEEKLLELVNNQASINNELSSINEALNFLDAAKRNPDSIDDSIFKSLFPKELDKTISDLLFFKGWFEINSEESQIKSSRTALNDLITSKENELKTKIDLLNNKNSEDLEKIEKCKSALATLRGYNDESFINREQLKTIDEIIDIVDSSEDVLKAYLEIAINNSKHLAISVPFDDIPIEQINERTNVEEELLRLEPSSNIEEIEEEKSLKEKYEEKINKFLDSTPYKDVKDIMPRSLYESIKTILSKAKESIEDADFGLLIGMLDEFGTNVLNFNDVGYLTLGYTIKILEAIEARSHDDLKEAVKEYNRKYRAGLREEKAKAEKFEQEFADELRKEELEEIRKKGISNDFIAAEGLQEYVNYLVNVENKYEIRKFLGDSRYSESLRGLTDKEIKASFTGDDYYKYCIAGLYEKMVDILLTNDNSDDKKKELKDLKTEIELIIKELEENNTPTAEPTIYDEYKDQGKDFNYVIFFDIDEFNDSYDSSKRSSSRTKKAFAGEVMRCFDEGLFTTDPRAFNDEHTVMISESNPNNDGIVGYRVGELRVTSKLLENPQIKLDKDGENHNLIIVFHVVFGSTDKTKTLQEALKTFNHGQRRYEELKRIFSKDGTKEEQEREIKASLEVLKKISNTAGRKYNI